MKRLSESASSEQFYGYGLLIPKIEVFYFETWGMILNSMDLQGALTGPIYVSVEISMPSPGPPPSSCRPLGDRRSPAGGRLIVRDSHLSNFTLQPG